MCLRACLWKEAASKALNEFDVSYRTHNTHRVIRSLTAAEISGGMLRQEPYSLNALSHDTAAELISLALVRCCITGRTGTPLNDTSVPLADACSPRVRLKRQL